MFGITYYFSSKNKQLLGHIEELHHRLDEKDEQIEKIANINKNSSSYISFSLKFINEILEKMKKGISYQDSLTELGYFRKYTNIKAYDYLPPLNPNSEDIEFLKNKIPDFNPQELFYQPLISPNVKRVISILRRLINELIKRYGKIDKIVIETARELNSKKDEEKIKSKN